MRVTRRLIHGVIASTMLFGVVNGAWRVWRSEQAATADMRHDHDFVGRTMRAAWLDAWRANGPSFADAMVRNANRAHPGISVKMSADARCFEGDLAGASRGGERHLVQGDHAVSCYPVRVPDGTWRALSVSESLATQRRNFRMSVMRNAFHSLVTMAVITLLIAIVGDRYIGRPVFALRAKARRVGAGDLSGPLHLAQNDELAELAEDFNAMCDRLALAQRSAEEEHRASIMALEQLRHADRLRAVGQLASGVAHELGTPLSVVLSRAVMLASGRLDADKVVENGRIIADQARRMDELIRHLLDYARSERGETAIADLGEVMSRVATMLRHTAQKAGVEVEVIAAGAHLASINTRQVQQVLTNLVMNAIQAMPEGGRLRVELGSATLTPPADVGGGAQRWHFIAVDDEGVGIAPENRARVFEPFFTTKGVGEGTGLGLSISYSIARDHGGWIAAEPRAPRGTRFTLFLPASAA